jgi:hypothetical protein
MGDLKTADGDRLQVRARAGVSATGHCGVEAFGVGPIQAVRGGRVIRQGV